MLAPAHAWNYRCNLQGCCCGGWRIALREPDWQRLRAATEGTELEEDFRLGVRRSAEGPVAADSPPALSSRRFGDAVAWMDTAADGRCRFLADGRCRVHATLGEGALPDICVAFPVSALRTPRGVECWFESACPEVLRTLAEAPEVSAIVPAPADFPRQVRYFQYDEPVRFVPVTPDRVTTFEEFDRFRTEALEALRQQADRPLDVLARAAAYVFRWAQDGAVDRPFGAFRAAGTEIEAVTAFLAERARETAARGDLPGRLAMARRLLRPLALAGGPLARLEPGAPLPAAGPALRAVAAGDPACVRVLANALVGALWANPLMTDDALMPGMLRILRNVGTGLYLAGALAPGAAADGASTAVGLALGEFLFRGRTDLPPDLAPAPDRGFRGRPRADLPGLARAAETPPQDRPLGAPPPDGQPEEALEAALRLRVAVTARHVRTAVRAALASPGDIPLGSPWDGPPPPEAREALEAWQQALEDAGREPGPVPALEAARRLGLDPLDTALVLLLALAGSDPAWARALAGATLDADGGRPSLASLGALLGPEVHRRLAPAARLCRLAVVRLDGEGRARLDPRVALALRGRLPGTLPPTLAATGPGDLPPGRVPPPPAVVESARRRLDALPPGPSLAVLSGSPGLDPAGVLARAADREVLAVEVGDPGEGGDLPDRARDAVREALLRDAVPLWILPGDAAARAAVGEAAGALARASGALLALWAPAWPEGLAGALPAVEIPLPAPAAEHLAAVVARNVPRDVRLSDPGALRQALGGLPLRCDQAAAAAAAASQRVLARGDARPVLPLGVLVGEVRAQLRSRIGEFADVEVGAHGLEALVLPDDSRERLREILAAWRHRDRVMDEWGLGRRVAGARGLSVLFYGPPGTGKTLAAGVVARELGLELFRVDLSRVVDKYVGETGKHLSRIFDEARRGQVLLLFDEADSLFGKRTAVSSSTDRYANLEVNHLLQRLEGHEGLVVLTTNHEKNLDEAFLRRLRYRVRFPMPDRSERSRLWRSLLPGEAPLVLPVDFESLGEAYEMSGGHIRNAVLRAAFRAAAAGRPLDEEGLRAAGDREYRDLGRLVRQEAPGS